MPFEPNEVRSGMGVGEPPSGETRRGLGGVGNPVKGCQYHLSEDAGTLESGPRSSNRCE